MEYEALTKDDLANVRALNRTWLRLENEGLRLPRQRLGRLAGAPFLLFSLSEHDEDRWERLLDEEHQVDLFEARKERGFANRDLQATALAFLWGLARRNPFAARVVSGASLAWCDRIASVTVVHLLDSAARGELVEPRFAQDSAMRRRMYVRGSSRIREKRVFAQMAALQSILTATGSERYIRVAAAACHMPTGSRKVADKL